MCKSNSKHKDECYEIIRKYEGKITCEEAVIKIIEKHKSIQVAYDGGNQAGGAAPDGGGVKMRPGVPGVTK